jgi:hypothetical protein
VGYHGDDAGAVRSVSDSGHDPHLHRGRRADRRRVSVRDHVVDEPQNGEGRFARHDGDAGRCHGHANFDRRADRDPDPKADPETDDSAEREADDSAEREADDSAEREADDSAERRPDRHSDANPNRDADGQANGHANPKPDADSNRAALVGAKAVAPDRNR